jgi:glyoxylase-like metal-dependent hydrolase (beta-lactamase superfamily II)
VVDAPSGVTPELLAAIAEEGVTVSQIVITHGHWDHVADAAAMKAAIGAPLAGHPTLAERLANPPTDAPVAIPPAQLDTPLNEGDTVRVGGSTFTVLFLPGHDLSHIALYSEADRIFLGGDVLFPNGHGRTDIPGSDQATMDKSLARLATLPEDVVVYPGHGGPTTIGRELHWLAGKLTG